MGPVFLLEAILQLFSGTSFFREVGKGNTWIEQNLSSFLDTGTFDSSDFGVDIGTIIVGLVSVVLALIAKAAILFAIDHLRKNEAYTVGSVIKQAFSRFWPMIGSNLLFGFITFWIIIFPIVMVTLTAVFGYMVNPILGVLGAILLFLGFAVGIGLLLTRWSFYFGSVVLDKESPGLGRSWRLSRKRTWALMGLYIIFYLIISSISFAIEMTFGSFLGNSVLLTLIVNIATLFTTMIFSVGYAVMYLDLKTRHDADDLKEMIEDYNTKTI